MSPKIVDKDERREEILLAATRVFARKGYAATRIEDVAIEAGIAKGTAYIYFGSRDEMLVAAFEVLEKELLASVRLVLEKDDPALTRLRTMVLTILSGLEAEPELSRVVLDFWAAGAYEGGGAEGEAAEKSSIDFGRIYAEYREILGGLLREAKREGSVRDGVPDEAPEVIVGSIEGVVLQWIVDPETMSPRRMAEPILDVLLNGLVAQEAR